MLTAFCDFISFRRQQPLPQQQPAMPRGTTVAYRSGAGLLFVTNVIGGPGGILELTDQESSDLIKDISLDMYIGRISCELSPDQITNSNVYKTILQTRAREHVSMQISSRSSPV